LLLAFDTFAGVRPRILFFWDMTLHQWVIGCRRFEVAGYSDLQ